MSDDVKALIAEARRPAVVETEYGPMYRNDHMLIERLVAALEASEAERDRIMAEWTRAEAELEASVRAPAVDREALAREIAGLLESDEYGGCDCGNVSPRCAPALAVDLLASGILLDAAEVEARGLEKFAAILDEWDSLRYDTPASLVEHAIEVARSRAQQVREGDAK